MQEQRLAVKTHVYVMDRRERRREVVPGEIENITLGVLRKLRNRRCDRATQSAQPTISASGAGLPGTN
ncbi:MAG: hypothetical protein ABSD75_03555 [Terriglobales bacterium]|jgi:hypothetical protein